MRKAHCSQSVASPVMMTGSRWLQPSSVSARLLFISLLACHAHSQMTHLVTVSDVGENSDECLSNSTGIPPCKSLDYVLNKGVGKFQNKSIEIEVSYSHTISSINASLQGILSMSINGTDLVTITCLNSSIMLFKAASLKILNVVVRGCYNRDYYTYGVAFYDSTDVQLSHSVFSSTGGVLVSNVERILLEECHFTDNTITNECDANNMASPLLVTDIHSATALTILRSFFTGNWVRVAQCSQTKLVAGGLMITLPYNSHPDCNITLANNSFKNNTAVNGIGAGAFLLSASSTASKASKFLVELTNNSFIGNKVDGSYQGSGNIDFHFEGCNDFILRSTGNKYNFNVGEGYLPGALAVSVYKNQCWVNSYIEFQFFSDTFNGNVGSLGGGAANIYFSTPTSSDACKTKEFAVSLHFFHCMFFNNTATYGAALDVASSLKNFKCYGEDHLSMTIEECFFSKNAIVLEESGLQDQTTNVVNTAIAYFVQVCMEIINSTFLDNRGTALVLDNVLVNFSELVIIDNNTGVNGGGIRWDHSFSVDIKPGTVIKIINNNAVFGGGIFFDYIQKDCVLTCNGRKESLGECNATIMLLNNSASSNGHMTFMKNPLPLIGNSHKSCVKNDEDILHMLILPDPPNGTNQLSSLAQHITPSIDNPHTLNVFPGQVLSVNATPLDWWRQNTSCSAVVYLLCGDPEMSYCGQDDPMVSGPAQQLLHSNSSKTELIIKSEEGPLLQSPLLVLRCTYASTAVILNLTSCPYGFTYNSKERVCDCPLASSNSINLLCTPMQGDLCIKDGYWYGKHPDNSSMDIVVKCLTLYCNSSESGPCPIEVTGDDKLSGYLLLSSNPNNQCTGDHGGFMCSNCKQGYTFSFQGIHCLPNSICQPWHPYIILSFTILYQVMVMIVLLLSLKLKSGSAGSGYLYGPLFCIAASSALLDFAACSEEHLISIKSLNSILLLNPIILGYLNWCFFKDLDNISNYVFRFFIPVGVFVSLLILVVLTRKCNKCVQMFQKSPLKLICLLILLSFWSVAKTSVTVLLPIRTDIGFRVWIQPDLSYFEGLHALYGTIAFVFLLFLMMPFTILLFLTPFLHGKISLARVKPFVDEFYACYQDKYRWYASVYFFSWIVLSFSQFSSTALQVELIAIATLQIVLRPYTSLFLNVVDSFLLLNLVVLSTLTDDKCYQAKHDTSALILVMTVFLIPYMYALGGLAYIIAQNIISMPKLNIWVHRVQQNLLKWLSKAKIDDKQIVIDYSYSEREGEEERGPSYLQLTNVDEEFRLEAA